MAYSLSTASREKLAGLHPDLVAMVERAIATTPVDFTVIEGLRSVKRQRQLVARGASKTMNSRHLTGHAVDIVPYCDVDGDGKREVSWSWPDYYPLAKAIKRAAAELGIAIEWGGDWSRFKDGPHWQLPWKSYPKGDMRPRARTLQPEPVAIGDAEVDDAPPITEKTETRVATEKSVAIGASGGSGAVAVGAEPLQDLSAVIAGQQAELSSGDLLRMGIALILVCLTAYGIWRTWR